MVQRRTKSSTASTEITQISSLPVLLPGEDKETYESLRKALLSDLAPQTAYERVIVEDIVNLEWEKVRHRRMGNQLILTEARRLAALAFHPEPGVLATPDNATPLAKYKAFRFVSTDDDEREQALAELIQLGEDPQAIMAEAYRRVSQDVAVHERNVAETEVRRRRLMQDYDNLRASRARNVSPATA